MYRGSRRTLFPALLVVFAGLLLGLLRAATPPSTASGAARPVEPTSPEVPWEPLHRAPGELRAIEEVLASTPKKQRLGALERLQQDVAQSPLTRGLASFAAGMLELGKNRGRAVEHFRAREIGATELSAYALYFMAQDLEPSDRRAALEALGELGARYPDFALMEEARLRHSKLLAEEGDREEAVHVLMPVAMDGRDEKLRGTALDELSKHLAALKRYEEAIQALETLYYELPRHRAARNAGRRLTAMRKRVSDPGDRHMYELGLRRAEILMEKRRFSDAYNGLVGLLRRYSKVADEDLVRLRMAECQYRRRQLTASVGNFKKVRRADLVPEALFYQAEVARRLRHKKTYRQRIGDLERDYPKSAWTEKALSSLAEHHLSNEEPEAALKVFEEIVRRFPGGEHALNARWHLLFHAFKQGRYEEAGYGLEEATREQPGAGELARLLYWAGRSYKEAGRFDRAEALFHQVLLGYQNSYYGRRAFEHLAQMQGQGASWEALESARRGIDLSDALVVERVDRQARVAQLLAVGHPNMALREAESAVQGKRDDAAFLAMAAWIHSDQQRTLDAIITIRRAFPFHVSATGDLLPRPIWELFYPLPYREHVETYAAKRGLDPYLVAALIRQESTFNPRVRSRAGARGLMQIIPATGRQLARRERRRYRVRDLYNPEINIQYGTRYLKEVLSRFNGRVDYALASYNAGPHRVKRWTGMDMSIDPEVFIEEIPFDETRSYVKLVLRNEMLYRRLYGGTESVAAAGE